MLYRPLPPTEIVLDSATIPFHSHLGAGSFFFFFNLRLTFERIMRRMLTETPSDDSSWPQDVTNVQGFPFVGFAVQWGAADAEIKVPSGENTA